MIWTTTNPAVWLCFSQIPVLLFTIYLIPYILITGRGYDFHETEIITISGRHSGLQAGDHIVLMPSSCQPGLPMPTELERTRKVLNVEANIILVRPRRP